MLENTASALITKFGILKITKDGVVCKGFEGNEETSCRDVAALVCCWGIAKLQRELSLLLEGPGKSRVGLE